MLSFAVKNKTKTKHSILRQKPQVHTKGYETETPFLSQHNLLTTVPPQMNKIPSANSHASFLNCVINFCPYRAFNPLLHLQRQYGNQYTLKVLALARKPIDKMGSNHKMGQDICRSQSREKLIDKYKRETNAEMGKSLLQDQRINSLNQSFKLIDKQEDKKDRFRIILQDKSGHGQKGKIKVQKKAFIFNKELRLTTMRKWIKPTIQMKPRRRRRRYMSTKQAIRVFLKYLKSLHPLNNIWISWYNKRLSEIIPKRITRPKQLNRIIKLSSKLYLEDIDRSKHGKSRLYVFDWRINWYKYYDELTPRHRRGKVGKYFKMHKSEYENFESNIKRKPKTFQFDTKDLAREKLLKRYGWTLQKSGGFYYIWTPKNILLYKKITQQEYRVALKQCESIQKATGRKPPQPLRKRKRRRRRKPPPWKEQDIIRPGRKLFRKYSKGIRRYIAPNIAEKQLAIKMPYIVGLGVHVVRYWNDYWSCDPVHNTSQGKFWLKIDEYLKKNIHRTSFELVKDVFNTTIGKENSIVFADSARNFEREVSKEKRREILKRIANWNKGLVYYNFKKGKLEGNPPKKECF